MEMTIKEAFLFIGDLMERAYGWHINDRVLGIDIGEFEGKCEGLIRLLKAQEPKLMTLDLPPAEWDDKVIWLEIKGKEPIPCLLRECRNRMMFGRYERLMYFDVVGSYRESGYMLKNYGVKWRCWSQKPTEEQRRATLWR